MTDVITYKDRTELNAIVAWCDDHASELDSVRRLFAPDPQSFKEEIRTSFREELAPFRSRLEAPDLADGLAPESGWREARSYMARLICYVWDNIESYNSNTKAADYVFRVAREGSRLYADCRYARTLLAKYDKQVSTIQKEAKLLHARERHYRKGKWRGMDKPQTWAQLVKASRTAEDRQIKKERKHGLR